MTYLLDDFSITMKAVRLETFNKERKLLTRASGFLIRETDGLFLYTCWHVVTGIDFLNLNRMTLPISPSFIKLSCTNVETQQPNVRRIGGTYTVEVSLYDQSGNPTWVQDSNEREQPDLAALNIRVPRIDMVRIPISLDPPVAEVVEFQKANTYWSMLQPGSDCVILGYPYGYNSMGMTTPLPIFLKRAIAANITENIGHALLDGGGAPGMSGSPVITRRDGGWRVMGMYTGVIFPDHQYGPVDFKNDKGAALGMMIPLHFGRTFLNVPDLVSE